MIAHLYRIRSDFRNVPDKIIIKAKAKENFPGTWLHAEVELPDFKPKPVTDSFSRRTRRSPRFTLNRRNAWTATQLRER